VITYAFHNAAMKLLTFMVFLKLFQGEKVKSQFREFLHAAVSLFTFFVCFVCITKELPISFSLCKALPSSNQDIFKIIFIENSLFRFKHVPGGDDCWRVVVRGLGLVYLFSK